MKIDETDPTYDIVLFAYLVQKYHESFPGERN